MAITPDELRALRRSLGLTQGQLADRLCLSREAITQWETGRAGPTGPAEMLLRMFQAEAAWKSPPQGQIQKESGKSPQSSDQPG
jgi:DNA-binding transcriptional regulator YiaG